MALMVSLQTRDSGSESAILGKVLNYVHIDTIYTNCMRVETCYDGPNYLVCNGIEEYIRYEQHRSNIAQQVSVEDMKVENRNYGNIVTLHYVSLVKK